MVLSLYLLIFEIFTAEFWERAISPEKALEYSTVALRVVIVLLLAWIATLVVNRLVPKFRLRMVSAMRRDGKDLGEFAKRAQTLSALFRRTVTSLIWVVALITALQQTGFDIAPILATAGVAGLAISFGAQNLVRDIFAGVFILLEDQIRVGDVAKVNGTGGLVEEINLRTVRLRGLDGIVHIFPNGTITTLSNLTQEFSFYVWDLGVAYKEDTDHVVATVKDLAEEMRREPHWNAMILEPLEVMGVDQFGDNAVVIKMRIKTKPIQQWAVGRELNRRIKKRFDELGIEIPFPHRTLYLGEGVAKELEGAAGKKLNRDMLKEVVREVMAELREGADAGLERGSREIAEEKEPEAKAQPKQKTKSQAKAEPVEGDGHSSSPDERQERERGDHDAPPGG